MKVKVDFITNSSSASIMLYIESMYDDLELFKERFNNYIERYKEKYPEEVIHFWDPQNIQQLTPHTYLIEYYLSMYNDADDIPHYIRTLVLESLVDVEKGRLFDSYGIKGANIRVKMD